MNNNLSRTENVVKNSYVSIICQFAYLLIGFVTRTIFSLTLGSEYLGINGLFTNILTILSFAELGIGSALVYRLYLPISTDDHEKIKELIHVYKKAYIYIVLVIAIVGIAIVPILPYIVDAPNIKEDLTLIYILFLLQTITSYCFVYKKSILIADQKNYIVEVYTQIFYSIMSILQCVFLLFTHNFIIYCILNIVFNLISNIICSRRASILYPYINEKPKNKLSKNEKKSLFKDVKGLMLTKIASTAFSGTDNIFISIFIGIKEVGVLSNYTMILTIVNSFMNKLFNSITASIGNLVVTGEINKSKSVLEKMFFINTAIYGLLFVGMVPLLNEFVTTIWLNETFSISKSIVVIALIELILRSVHYPIYITRNAMGSFSEYKLIVVFTAILNIILDFIFIKPLGIFGLFLSTIICRGICYLVDIYVVYKVKLNISAKSYLWMFLRWMLFISISIFFSELSVLFFDRVNLWIFLLKCIIITVEYSLLFWIFFHKTKEYIYFKSFIAYIIKRNT